LALPTPSDFFQDNPEDVLSQGDIVLSPSSVLWAEGRTPAPEFGNIPPAPEVGEAVVTPAWDSYDQKWVPQAFHETRWSPVMVLSHPCDMEKEFNRRVRELETGGMLLDEAIRAASADPNLDRLVVVAPVLPYAEIPEVDHQGVGEGRRIGFFPVPTHEVLEEETFVPLSRACTVDRMLLIKHQQIASLTPLAVGVLRYKLSECFTARDLSIVAELQSMVGEVIDDVIILPKNKKTSSLQLYLRNGEVVHLEIRQPQESFLEEVRRLGSVFRKPT
jgi:hypothetical protein